MTPRSGGRGKQKINVHRKGGRSGTRTNSRYDTEIRVASGGKQQGRDNRGRSQGGALVGLLGGAWEQIERSSASRGEDPGRAERTTDQCDIKTQKPKATLQARVTEVETGKLLTRGTAVGVKTKVEPEGRGTLMEQERWSIEAQLKDQKSRAEPQ